MAEPKVGVSIEPGLQPVRAFHDGEEVTGLDDRGRPITGKTKPKVIVLIQNFQGQFLFAPDWLAEQMVKDHKAIILTPHDGEIYLRATRLALGIMDGYAPGTVVQVFGKAVSADAIGKFDANKVLKAAEEAIEAAKKNPKESEIVDPSSFSGRLRQRQIQKP